MDANGAVHLHHKSMPSGLFTAQRSYWLISQVPLAAKLKETLTENQDRRNFYFSALS